MATPLKPVTQLVAATIEEMKELSALDINYRELVGALSYLSITTRPDVTHAVGALSQFLNNPSINHWRSPLQTLPYLKGSKNLGITFHRTNAAPLSVSAFSDSDYGSCLISRKSISVYVVLLNGNLVSWRSKKQSAVTLSSTEAEYVALCDCVKELQWINILLHRVLSLPQTGPSLISIDNMSELTLANNLSNQSGIKTKHMDIHHHFVRQELAEKHIELCHVASQDNLSDFLAKSVPKLPLEKPFAAY